ncbi:MAG: hypothetical protein WBG73_13675 [Coleofasciculaceae cyanobacterium]
MSASTKPSYSSSISATVVPCARTYTTQIEGEGEWEGDSVQPFGHENSVSEAGRFWRTAERSSALTSA